MNSKSLLAVSLCLNLVTIVAVAYLLKTHPSPSDAQPARPEVANNAPVPGAKSVVTQVVTNPTVHTIDWRMVESEDYKKYIANMRSIGCPEETIKDIIVADVNKLFESRKKALRSANTNRFEFWKAGNPLAGMFDEEKIKQQRELAKEKRALLKELLGIEPDEKPDMFAGVNPMETMFDFLPASKQNQVLELMQNYQLKMAKRLGGGGVPDTEDMKEVQKAQKDMETEMAKLLTPQEFEDYQLRLSQTSMMMRMQLASFEPSEQEFRDVFKLKKKFDDEFSVFGMPSTDKAEMEKRVAAQKELDAQVKNAIGDSRFTEYQRAQDWAYQGIAKVVERQGLPKDTAVKVYDMKKVAEEQVGKLRSDSSLSQEKRNEALRAIQAETERTISATLGEKGFESYKKQPAAMWMQNIAPPAQKPLPEVRPTP